MKTKVPAILLSALVPLLYACNEKDTKNEHELLINTSINPEKPDVPLNKNDAFQKVQKRRVQEKR